MAVDDDSGNATRLTASASRAALRPNLGHSASCWLTAKAVIRIAAAVNLILKPCARRMLLDCKVGNQRRGHRRRKIRLFGFCLADITPPRTVISTRRRPMMRPH